jgi:hypothetical protein
MGAVMFAVLLLTPCLFIVCMLELGERRQNKLNNVRFPRR